MNPGTLLALARLAFRQNLSGMRKYGYGALVLLPALFALLWVALKGDEPAKFFLGTILAGFHFKLVLPLIGVLVGVDAINLDRQNGTLIYLVTRPVAKWVLYAAKTLSAIAFAVILSTLTVLLAFLVLWVAGDAAPAGDLFPILGWGVLHSAVTVVAYVTVFTAIGAAIPFPLGLSLGFGFVWEGIVGSFDWRFAKYTIINSGRGLLYAALDARPEFTVGAYPLAGLVAVSLVAFAAGTLSFALASHTK